MCECYKPRPVRSDGSTRRASFEWFDKSMAGEITIRVDAEFAFEDEEPGMNEIVARDLRKYAERLHQSIPDQGQVDV